ncbi:hypothetical protein [Burkholderia pseudomallei]|uniref:hypothetical protein n=2 Tax=Burkholderia pseudomallei TaxID=28450 RepID=UPI00100AF4E8|nr:hypothetical protein [Burkholderia pseudomallei]QDH28130.1 hypothetical protein FKO42_11615 [Burkholderia pseudomallei]QDH38405.1 hypothetical protein FKO59_11600 [Burkholderia pseudomallei]
MIVIQPVLEQAHRYHLDLRRWQRRWVELTRGVDTQLLAASSYTSDYRDVSYLLIRNSGESVIDELLLCAEAKNGKMKFQESIRLFRLEPGEVFKVTLRSFPIEAIWATESGIFSSYESTEIFPVRLARDGQIEEFKPMALRSYPTHVDHLNPGWQRWAGKLYNVKALEDAILDLKFHWAHRFCGRYGLLGFSSKDLLGDVLSSRRYGRLLGVVLYALMANRWMLTLVTWVPLVLRKKRLKFEIDSDMRDATEYVLRRGEGARPIRILRKADAASSSTA